MFGSCWSCMTLKHKQPGSSRSEPIASTSIALRKRSRASGLTRTFTHSASIAASLSKAGLTANRRDRDMAHRRVGLGAMPMALPGLDVHDVADIDLVLFMLGGDHAGARGHDQ